eukprot:GFUD01053368.1.p1 GENE.GFUD01053368.1~~GFUD01053368.1.p1  ORF type:complete len:225 (+),score=58.54 GFUD01053368.1:42-716(+)
MFAVLLLLCLSATVKDSSSLNLNFGANNVIEIFAVTNNDIANNTIVTDDDPPPHNQAARMARYITHTSNWGAMATVAVREPIVGFPFANIFSLSDGPVDQSSGTPYMYISPWEVSAHDLRQNNQTSITMSLAQGNYCSKMNYDPEDPRCAHIILTGTFVKLTRESEEGQFAKKSLFSRHPIMPEWPEDHGWFFAKLDIKNILVLDFFGGAVTVPLEEYFNANPK